MDITRLFQDFSIETAGEGHKHNRPGWTNIECPFCTGTHAGYHLGWNIHGEYFFCWRCGWKPPVKTISTLLKIPYTQAENILDQYSVNKTKVKTIEKGKKEFKLPSRLKPINKRVRRYLKERGFRPRTIEKLWKIKMTEHISKLDYYDYRFRIFIPYFWNNQIVTFDTRDYTEKAEDKYKACPKEREIFERKNILYGNQEFWGDVGICVEGPTDVWNFGPYSFAVSGIQFTTNQVRLIAQIFKRVWIVFDAEQEAQRQANKLMKELRFRGVECDNIVLEAGMDPGNMPRKQAKELVNKLLI